MKIPARGPATVKLSDGRRLELWYDRSWRSWGVAEYDANGLQTGPGIDQTALWFHGRPEAVEELQKLVTLTTNGVR